MKRSKSPFDTGNWSEVNGLPGQQDIMNFLEHLTANNPNRCFTRRQLMDEVAKEFEIPAAAQEAEGPKSNTSGYYTRLTYLISDAIAGVRRAEGRPFLKRIAFSVYQHVTGNGEVDAAMVEHLRGTRDADMTPSVPNPAAECLAFFKHGRKIGFTLGEMQDFAKGITKWDAEMVDSSLKQVYA
jgi:hypothetical protein